jgi:putative addiction module component (TIGR02574 family)
MAPDTLAQLLKLPANERGELAVGLWESLADADREAAFTLSDEQRAELDRRWDEHLADPGPALPWDVVERRLRDSASTQGDIKEGA